MRFTQTTFTKRGQCTRVISEPVSNSPAQRVTHRQLSSTPPPSSQLASSAPRRGCRMRPYRLFRPRCRWIRGAKPAAGDARARCSSQSTAAAGCGREQTTHRRVHEVAHAGHQHPRYERLGHQHKQTGVKGKILSLHANPVRSERRETIEI
jgi:hypothetical protein